MYKLEHSHEPEDIAKRLSDGPRISYLRDWVYGGIDGAVTTFAIVAGVVGADLSNRVVLLLGAANVVADGFSMAAANYTGTKSEIEEYEHIRHMEERHISQHPEGEREEIRQIFRSKGFEGEDLERAVEVITEKRDRWIETMMSEEHGLPTVTRSPVKAALLTFAAFMLCGIVPLLPYALFLPSPAYFALVMTALVFFAIGSLRSFWSLNPWWYAGLETMFIGLTAAAAAYIIGDLLKDIF